MCGSNNNWFSCVREEHRLRVFEDRVLRRIFGLMSERGSTSSMGKIA
jgi:hypothetical protein